MCPRPKIVRHFLRSGLCVCYSSTTPTESVELISKLSLQPNINNVERILKLNCSESEPLVFIKCAKVSFKWSTLHILWAAGCEDLIRWVLVINLVRKFKGFHKGFKGISELDSDSMKRYRTPNPVAFIVWWRRPRRLQSTCSSVKTEAPCVTLQTTWCIFRSVLTDRGAFLRHVCVRCGAERW